MSSLCKEKKRLNLTQISYRILDSYHYILAIFPEIATNINPFNLFLWPRHAQRSGQHTTNIPCYQTVPIPQMTLSEWKRGVSKVYNIYQTILKPSFLPTSGFILDLCVFSLQPIQGLELKNLKHPWIQKRSTPQNWRPPAPFRRSPVSAAWKKPQGTAWTSWNPAFTVSTTSDW